VKLSRYLGLKEFLFFFGGFFISFQGQVVLDFLNRYPIDLGSVSLGESKKGCTRNLSHNRVV
jgi:hypothetical protein